MCLKQYNLLKLNKLIEIKNKFAIKIQSIYRKFRQRKVYLLLLENKKLSVSISKGVIKNLINRTINIIKKKEKMKKQNNRCSDNLVSEENKLEEKSDLIEEKNDLIIFESKQKDIIKKKKKKNKKTKKKKLSKSNSKNNKIDDDEFYSVLEEFKQEYDYSLDENNKSNRTKSSKESKHESKIIESKDSESKKNIYKDYKTYSIFSKEKERILKHHKGILKTAYFNHKLIRCIFQNMKEHNYFSENRIKKFKGFISEVLQQTAGLDNVLINDSYKIKVLTACDNSVRLKNYFVNQNALYFKMKFDLILMKSDILFIKKLLLKDFDFYKKDFDFYKKDKLENSFKAIINFPFGYESSLFLEGLTRYFDDNTNLIFEKVKDESKPAFTLIQIILSFYNLNFYRLYNYVRNTASVDFYTRKIEYDNINDEKYKNLEGPNIQDKYLELKTHLITDWMIYCKKKKISKDLSLESEYLNWKLI